MYVQVGCPAGKTLFPAGASSVQEVSGPGDDQPVNRLPSRGDVTPGQESTSASQEVEEACSRAQCEVLGDLGEACDDSIGASGHVDEDSYRDFDHDDEK